MKSLVKSSPDLGNDQATAWGDEVAQAVGPVLVERVKTTDATTTTLLMLAVPASQTVLVEARVLARRTGGSAGTAEDGAAYLVRAAFNTVAGAATLIGSVSQIFVAESQAGWNCTLDASTTFARVRVTGAVDNNITWAAAVTVRGLNV